MIETTEIPENISTCLNSLSDAIAALGAIRDVGQFNKELVIIGKTLCRADGATLYRVDENSILHFEVLLNESLGLVIDASVPEKERMHPINVYTEDGSPNPESVAAQVAHHGRTINIKSIRLAEGFDFSFTEAFDAVTGYQTESILTVPIRSVDHEVVGVLQLVNSRDESGRTASFTADMQLEIEIIAAVAARTMLF